MLQGGPTRLITYDIRRTTEVLEIAAGDLQDEFLQYLFGMAILHLTDRLDGKQPQEIAPSRSEADDLIKDLAEQVIAAAHR